jgi:hypothetical protein
MTSHPMPTTMLDTSSRIKSVVIKAIPFSERFLTDFLLFRSVSATSPACSDLNSSAIAAVLI